MTTLKDVIAIRDEKFSQDLATERELYDQAVEIAHQAHNAPAQKRDSLYQHITEIRKAVLSQDLYVFDRQRGDDKPDLEIAAAKLSINAHTRDAITAHIALAEQRLYSAARADEARENLRLIRWTLGVSGATLVAAIASIVVPIWYDNHRSPQPTNDTVARAIAHSLDPRCGHGTEDTDINGAFMEGCPGYREGKFDADRYLQDIASGARK